MRKSLALALLIAVAIPLTANRAQAQGMSFIPYIGYNIDAEAFLVGVGTEFSAPFSAGNLALGIRPSVEYLFTEDLDFGSSEFSQTFLQVNGDLIARLNAANFNPYVGAGLAIAVVSTDFDCEGNSACEAAEEAASGSDFGLNLLGGLEFSDIGFGTPFVQGRLTLLDGSAISILGGINIPLGR